MSNHDIIMVLSGLENICLIIGTVKSVLHEFQSYGPIYNILIGVSRGGGSGRPDPPFPGPPLFSCDPPSTQPDLTDKCNVNCFLIV